MNVVYSRSELYLIRRERKSQPNNGTLSDIAVHGLLRFRGRLAGQRLNQTAPAITTIKQTIPDTIGVRPLHRHTSNISMTSTTSSAVNTRIDVRNRETQGGKLLIA